MIEHPPKPKHPLIMKRDDVTPGPTCEHDDARWLAMLIRQGLKLIVVGIEHRYGLDNKKDRAA